MTADLVNSRVVSRLGTAAQACRAASLSPWDCFIVVPWDGGVVLSHDLFGPGISGNLGSVFGGNAATRLGWLVVCLVDVFPSRGFMPRLPRLLAIIAQFIIRDMHTI